MKHTPAPWEVVARDPFEAGISWEIQAVNEGVLGNRIIAVGFEDAPIGFEDAQLMASAPDLLAALERIVNNYDTGNYKDIDMPQARAAIKKAKGES